MTISKYYNLERAKEMVQQGRHRIWIGVLWDEIGQLQFDYMQKDGLQPDVRLNII